jgi:RNA polymerase sigma-70 factor (ECF subfamily)
MTDSVGSRQSPVMKGPSAVMASTDVTAHKPDFADLFEREFDYVWFTLRRFGVSARDLEDVTHDVFIQVYKHLDRYDPHRPLRPWLFGFAYRIASDYRGLARHRIETLEDRVEVADPSPSAVDHIAARQALELARSALDMLDLDRRAVFLLHEVEGFPIPEIAEALQIPLNTAYSRLRLARDEFAKAAQRLRLRRGET